MSDERDELDPFLDTGRARYGGAGLATALDDAVTWAETRAARRRRVARTWIAGGILAGLLGGGAAVATAVVGRSEPAAVPASIMLSYALDTGASCNVEIQPVVHSADPAAWAIARTYLASVDPPRVDLNSLIDGGRAGDQEIATLTDVLRRGSENEIRRRVGTNAEVVLRVDYSCSAAPVASDEYAVTPPIAGEDFGREPTQLGGRAPDVVAFFRASTGQICEIQIKVEPDWVNGPPQDGEVETARAFLATVDFTTIDYSDALNEMEPFWPEERDRAEREASALSRTVTEQMFLALDPTGTAALPVMAEGWSQCDPEPAE